MIETWGAARWRRWDECCLSPDAHERHLARLKREHDFRVRMDEIGATTGYDIIEEPARFERAIRCATCGAYLGSVEEGYRTGRLADRPHRPGCGHVIDGIARPVAGAPRESSNHGQGDVREAAPTPARLHAEVVDEGAPGRPLGADEGVDQGRTALLPAQRQLPS